MIPTPPPYDENAEKALIGCALDGKFDAIRSVGVNEEYFNSLQCRKAWSVMEQLDEEGVAIEADKVSHKVRTLDVDTLRVKDIAEMFDAAPTSSNWAYYAQICSEKRKARKVQQIGLRLAEEAGTTDSVEELVSAAESEIFTLSDEVARDGNSRKESFKRVIGMLEDAHEGRQRGVPTGYPSIDKLLGGLRPGQLIVIAARPAVGKSALVGNIAANLALKGVPVGFFSYEMSDDELNLRMLCSYSDANLIGDILNGGLPKEQQSDAIHKAVGALPSLMKAPVNINDDGKLTINQLRSVARRMVKDEGVQLIIVDYIQLIQPSKDDAKAQRHVQIGTITRGLKQMAMELDVPVLALAQLSRAAEMTEANSNGVRVPNLSMLRESGSIEQDADVCGLLYLGDPRMVEGPNMLMNLRFAKNRAGRQGEVNLVFVRNRIRFDETSQHEHWLNDKAAEFAESED